MTCLSRRCFQHALKSLFENFVIVLGYFTCNVSPRSFYSTHTLTPPNPKPLGLLTYTGHPFYTEGPLNQPTNIKGKISPDTFFKNPLHYIFYPNLVSTWKKKFTKLSEQSFCMNWSHPIYGTQLYLSIYPSPFIYLSVCVCITITIYQLALQPTCEDLKIYFTK